MGLSRKQRSKGSNLPMVHLFVRRVWGTAVRQRSKIRRWEPWRQPKSAEGSPVWQHPPQVAVGEHDLLHPVGLVRLPLPLGEVEDVDARW